MSREGKMFRELVTDNNFCDHQIAYIKSGIRHGLSKEQISLYANPYFNEWQMSEILHGLYDLSIEQVMLYAKPQLNCEKMRMIRKGLIDGLSMDEIINENDLCV